jgi:hypothetical protein
MEWVVIWFLVRAAGGRPLLQFFNKLNLSQEIVFAHALAWCGYDLKPRVINFTSELGSNTHENENRHCVAS